MNPAASDLASWGVILSLVAFIALWLFALNLSALLGGWRSLAHSYPAGDRPTGPSFTFRSGRFGFVNYGNCLRFVSGPTGLYIAVPALFRPGHPALFIPWEDVHAEPTRGWIFRYAEFRFAKRPAIRLRLRPALALELLAAGGNVVRLDESGRAGP